MLCQRQQLRRFPGRRKMRKLTLSKRALYCKINPGAKHIASLDHEQPHGPPFFVLSPASLKHHAQFLCLLASSTGVVGAMHFGSLIRYEEYTAAQRTSRDSKAPPDEVAKAKAVVARLEQEKKQNMAANGTTIFPAYLR